jgi:urea transport system ATP-binding protein
MAILLGILLVDQYSEFARDVASCCIAMQRGRVVLSGRQADMDETVARAYLTV